MGRDAVTVVAVDDADHAMIMRVFEGLTGLSSGTLVADREVANRSLTLPEIEAVRAFNRQLADEGLPRSAQSRLMHFGAARYLMQFEPDPAAARVVLPRWAAERAHQLSEEMVAGVADTGVRVVGDLAALTVPVGDAPESIPKTVDVPAKVAARMAVGIVLASGEARRSLRGQAAQPAAEMPQVSRTTSLELARVIAHARACGVGAEAQVAAREDPRQQLTAVPQPRCVLSGVVALRRAHISGRGLRDVRPPESETSAEHTSRAHAGVRVAVRQARAECRAASTADITVATACSSGTMLVSRVTSASRGLSYGEEIPVNSGTSPRRALA